MDTTEQTAAVTEDDVRVLARTAQVALRPQRVAALAGALEADLRLIRALRTIDAGETHPAGVAPLKKERADAHR